MSSGFGNYDQLYTPETEQPAPPGQEEDMGQVPGGDSDIPKALMAALEYKESREKQFGVKLDDAFTSIAQKPAPVTDLTDEGFEDELHDDEIKVKQEFEPGSSSSKISRNRKKKEKKKRSKLRKRMTAAEEALKKEKKSDKTTESAEDLGVDVEFVPDTIHLSFTDPNYVHFMKVFENFKLTSEPEPQEPEEPPQKPAITEDPTHMILMENLRKVPKLDDEEEDESKPADTGTLSKKKLRKQSRLSVAELKQLVSRPDVVEMHDVTAKDPKLLILLKSYRHTVPVPRHWNAKRKYLAGKRGFEKPPFDLPDFIKRTGITQMREALQEKEDAQNMKAKMRARVRPKMGKIDIDYQKLHDAFFKWQTKPKMTIHGDLYYEGKEFETRLKEKKPGDLSDNLRTALGMPLGGNKNKFPPPWLIAMQRYGPPPSYPNLRIPGLNYPIPDGCSFGYHAGGWGKPPVDEAGRPLYGDVFGQENPEAYKAEEQDDIDKTPWGEMESESESESESEAEPEETTQLQSGPTAPTDPSGIVTPSTEGLLTPSGLTSVPSGLETPDAAIELRKKKIEEAMEQGAETPQLYQVLQEKKAAAVGSSMMGSQHIYEITNKKTREEGVELSLDPSELEMVDSEQMQARYEGALRDHQRTAGGEDFSDMVAEHSAKQKVKRKKQMDSKTTKKHKEFKF